jgi:hypothetical protein
MTRFTKPFRSLIGALACGSSLLLAGQAQAAVLINVDTAGCNTNVAINNAIGQSFRVGAVNSLEKIEIWIKPELYYTTSYSMQLFAGEGTGGTLLATSATTVTLGSQTGGTASAFQAFSFTGQNVTLQPNQAYTFRLVRLSQYSGAFSMCGNVYADGIQYWLGYSADAPYDLSFKLYGAPPVPQTFPQGYLGCFTDSESRALPYYMGDGFTAESCKQVARTYGFRYAGTQYGGQCFIGPSIAGTQVSNSECSMPCSANPSEMCGNGWRNSLYDTQASTYQGCFTDDWSRALPAFLGEGTFTQESCVAAAKASGYRYAGLQWYGQCFAGNQLGYTQVSDSECNLPCTGDPAQTCGGGFRNQIYSTGL